MRQISNETSIFQVIAGDHFIRYDLKTKQGKIDVEVSSFKWKGVTIAIKSISLYIVTGISLTSDHYNSCTDNKQVKHFRNNKAQTRKVHY